LFVLLLTSIENQKNPGARAENLITLSIYWTEILIAIGAVVALFFAARHMFSNKKQALNTLFIFVAFAVVIVVSYLLATSEIPKFFGVEKFVADGSLTPSISKWIGTGLITTYILFAGAALSIVAFSLANVFKRS
jgi:small-conductance mechanosensitive channel